MREYLGGATPPNTPTSSTASNTRERHSNRVRTREKRTRERVQSTHTRAYRQIYSTVILTMSLYHRDFKAIEGEALRPKGRWVRLWLNSLPYGFS